MSRRLAYDQRIPLDAYYTPDAVAQACVGAVAHQIAPGDVVLEPSVGGGAFARALRQQKPGVVVHGCDVNPDAAGFASCHREILGDFLDVGARFSWIIGNPPYQGAEQHVRHALSVSSKGVAFLLRLAFLEGQSRRALWREHPASEVFVLSRRPSFTGGGTDATAYAFFVWRHAQEQQPCRLSWLDWRSE